MTNLFTCPKCDGSGHISQFNHVEAGLCFQCQGSGKVDHLPTTPDNAGIVDVIYNMVKSTGPDSFEFFSFYIWHEGTGKEHAGTGHWYLDTVDTTVIDDDCSYEPTYERRELEASGHHVTLDEVRARYKQAMRDGFVITTELNAMLTPNI